MIYFVETVAAEKRSTLCRWVERFYEEGKRVRIVVDSTQAAQHLDGLLWSFSETSFVPHRMVDPRATELEDVDNVVITVGEAPMEGFEVLVCDAAVSVVTMREYAVCVHFILVDDEERKQESRLLWQEVREGGLKPHHVPNTARGRR